jgi:hypothetical protein
MKVWVQAWEESEKGWGTHRDGYSMHLEKYHVQQFIKDYWDKMPDAVPEVYSRPDGLPFDIEVEPGYLERVRASKNGIRVHDWSPA